MIIFLSPHYDDAIYSCGGAIYEFIQAGQVVLIWTLMAGIPKLPLPDTPVLRDNHQRWQIGENPVAARRAEDQVAAEILGASTKYADILDCIYRTADDIALYPDEASLWHVIHEDDPAPAALNALSLDTDTQIYAPLGVGGHVDHLVVRDWAWQLAQNQQMTVQFYVEYPYLRQREAVEQAYENFPAPLNALERPFSEQAMQHKIRAMKAYQSQIASFWEDTTQISAEVRTTFTRNGQFVEEFVQVI